MRAITAFGLVLLLAAGGCTGSSDDAPTPTPTASAARSPTPTATASPSPTAAAQPSEALAVATEDGTLALEIPEGALPEGVEPSDIRVTTVSIAEPQPLEPPDPEAEEQASRLVAVFELEPAGLRFLRPVTLTFRLPRDIVDGPLVALHSSDSGVEPLAIALTELRESGEIEITATVEHFSSVMLVTAFIPDSDIIKMEVRVPETPVIVGSAFTASVDLRRLEGPRTVNVGITVEFLDVLNETHLFSIFRMPYVLSVERVPWELAGSFWSSSVSEGVISPLAVHDRPKRYLRVTGDTHHEEAIFKCERAGKWTIDYVGGALVEYEAMPATPPAGVELPRFESYQYSVGPVAGASGRCVAPPPEDSTTDTAPPEKDPPPEDSPPPEDGTPPEDSTTPDDTDAEPPPNRPPVVSAIEALFVPYLATTFYDVEISDPDGDRLTIAWSGHSCGETEGSTTEDFEWYHGDDVCPHTVASHPEATIQLFVTDRVWDVYCYYPGADDGTGKPCDEPVPSP